MTKIIGLQAENFKRLQAVSITPNGNRTIVVGGEPDQGKSSVLDSILAAMAGGKSLPPMPLRKGAKKGFVRLDLGELIVERTFNANGKTQLEVKSKDGYEAPTPQKILDDMCAKIAFDPLEFSRQKPKDQLTTLRGLLGLDFSALDSERASVFATRTTINRDLKQLEGELAGLNFFEQAPDKEVSIAELSAELDSVREHNDANESVRTALADATKAVERSHEWIKEKRAEIAAIQAKIDEHAPRIAAKETEAQKLKADCAALADMDPAPIRAKIASAEGVNAMVRQNTHRAAVESKAAEKEKRSEALTERIDAIDAEKLAMIEAAKFPIPGLGFGDDCVTFDGIPLEQASTNTKIRTSVAIGKAMNPDFRVMLIREGSLLGLKSLDVIEEMMADWDGQAWIERVSEGVEVSVVIEDGTIKENRIGKVEAEKEPAHA